MTTAPKLTVEAVENAIGPIEDFAPVRKSARRLLSHGEVDPGSPSRRRDYWAI
jgi:hypothetical protein